MNQRFQTKANGTGATLLAEKKADYAECRKARDEMQELLTVKANVDRILGQKKAAKAIRLEDEC